MVQWMAVRQGNTKDKFQGEIFFGQQSNKAQYMYFIK